MTSNFDNIINEIFDTQPINQEDWVNGLEDDWYEAPNQKRFTTQSGNKYAIRVESLYGYVNAEEFFETFGIHGKEQSLETIFEVTFWESAPAGGQTLDNLNTDYDPFGITNKQEALEVFSNVIQALEEIKDSISNPVGFMFSAKEPSRAKLYDRMTQRFGQMYAMKTYTGIDKEEGKMYLIVDPRLIED